MIQCYAPYHGIVYEIGNYCGRNIGTDDNSNFALHATLPKICILETINFSPEDANRVGLRKFGTYKPILKDASLT